MPLNTQQAVAGEEYKGKFLVHVFEAGTLDGFELAGDGWNVVAFSPPASPAWAWPGVIEITFRAIPTDADKPLSLTLTHNGRRVERSYEIGPAVFAQLGKVHRAISVLPPQQQGAIQPSSHIQVGTEGETAGGGSGLRVEGRIVYTRPCRDLDGHPEGGPDGDCDDPGDYPERIVGADHIDVRVWDSDTVGHEEIWSGYTDNNGYFDTGTVNWVDSGDEPDLVIYFETETVWLDVTDATVWESTYEFESDEVSDYTGSHYNFGWLTPANHGLHPALHIFNSITRTRRFISSRVGIDVPTVQVEWPHGDTGAWYESGPVEIHMSTERSWRTDTASHEYGHHFLHNFSATTTPDYCNGYCDPDPPDDCGHCMWCAETNHDAWNEGWPNWLADVVTRSFPQDYVFDDGSEFIALYDRSLENVRLCNAKEPLHDPWTTEGFAGALLRDIEDYDQDDPDGDGIRDSLCLGVAEIFNVVVTAQPVTPAQFIMDFQEMYPEHADLLWPTAYNVDPRYVANFFPPDAAPPSPVTILDSDTHPIFVGGTMPCITVRWLPPDDDAWGACSYSYAWATTAMGVEPDEIVDPYTMNGCFLETTGARRLGEHWFSIKAWDCAGNWGATATFGPFEVLDCNGSGYVDLCDIRCCDGGCTAGPESCSFTINSCPTGGCETSQDCNSNFAPDECDIASGFSNDCNNNGIPDECENMFNWDTTSGSWHIPSNWLEDATPTDNAEICIDVPGDQNVSYHNGAMGVGTLACSESFGVAGGTTPWAQLTLNQPSWVDGDLTLSGNNSILNVTDRLDIGGMFTWTGSNVTNSAKLTGSGVTHANGGLQVSNVVHLEEHHVIIDGNSTSVCDGRIDFVGASQFEIRPGSTYEHQGDGYILKGWFDDNFINQGTLIKSVDPGYNTIYMFTNNSGLIHVQTGMLELFLGSSSTGDFLADPGATFEFNGGNHEFLAGSSIVAESVSFPGGASGSNNIWGTYNVSDSTSVTGGPLTFHASATIENYGDNFNVCGGPVYFETILGETIHFNDISLTCGTIYFNSGDPIETQTLTVGPGTLRGPSDVTVTGLLTWNASGAFMGPSTVNANGGMIIGAGGGSKTLYDRVMNNAGTATFLGSFGMSGAASEFNNLPSGVMDIQVDSGANVVSAGRLNNAGTLVKTAGPGTSALSGEITNTGTVEVQIGVLEFYTHYNYFYIQTAGQTVLNGGDIDMFGPKPFQIDGGMVTGAGTITGNVLINNSATAAPGLSAGVLDVVGNYTQAAGGSLEIEIAGLDQGSGYDLLSVSGVASLAGDLNVIFLNGGFSPAPGDSFQIVTAGPVSGEFDSVSTTNLSPHLNMEAIYTPTDVTLIMTAVVSGDCDLDGDADLDDYADLAACLLGPDGGIGGTCGCFDFDDSGNVSLADFGAFQAVFTGM